MEELCTNAENTNNFNIELKDKKYCIESEEKNVDEKTHQTVCNNQTEHVVNLNNYQYDPSCLSDMLPVYYKRLFPHKHFYRWLSYSLSEEGIFTNREISFTLSSDVYMRYLSFETQNELEKEICTVCPFKIDIGAVMKVRPKNHRITSSASTPIQREIVFDIDISDYDNVRTCCQGINICEKCWKFMVVACRVVDVGLREDFGWEHIFWVFSGRRGIHCWVCDHGARHFDAIARASVAEYFQLVTHVIISNNISAPRVYIGEKMHHSIRRALKIVESMFEEIILHEQNLFFGHKGVEKLCHFISDDEASKDTALFLRNNVPEDAPSSFVWLTFKRYATSMRCNSIANIWSRRLRNIIEEIQLAALYPRLDINVTKGFNHLLKAPFCIHPSSGKISLPFSASAVAKLNPNTIPNITQLLHEINAFDDKNKMQDDNIDKKLSIRDYKKTSMFKGVLIFEEFLRKLENSLKLTINELNDQRLQF